MKMLLLPVISVIPALKPSAMFLLPVLWLSALVPMAVFRSPLLLLSERSVADGCVLAAGSVAAERQNTAGGVVAAGAVLQERIGAACGVDVAGGVGEERVITAGGVVGAGGVPVERVSTDRGVAPASRGELERGITEGRVFVALRIYRDNISKRKRAAGGVQKRVARRRVTTGIVQVGVWPQLGVMVSSRTSPTSIAVKTSPWIHGSLHCAE
jgi:hypothetical protein